MMGTWDTGLFDNDAASDLIGQISHQLLDTLEQDVSALDDGILEREGPAAAAILVALERAFGDVRFSIPDYDVPKWATAYKEWVNTAEFLEAWVNPDKAEANAAEIRRVFDELLEIWKESVA